MGTKVGALRRLARASAVAVGLWAALTATAPAGAAGAPDAPDVEVGGSTTGDGGEVTIGVGGSGSGGGTGAGAGRPRRCEHFRQDSDTATLPFGINPGEEVDPRQLRDEIDEDVIVIRVCTWLDTGDRDPPEILVVSPSPAALARRAAALARARLVLPLPELRTAPPGRTVVGMPTWMWSDRSAPAAASATLAGVTATVVATPARLVVDLGGERRRCAGAGTAFDPTRSATDQWGGCTWRFARPGDLVAEVTQVWRLTWTASTGDGGDLGEVARDATATVAVRELTTSLRRG